MEVPVTLGQKRKPLHNQACEIVINVLKFMKAEAKRGSPIVPVQNCIERTLRATQISASTYKRIKKESEAFESVLKISFSTLHKKKPKANHVSNENVIIEVVPAYSFTTPHQNRPRISPKTTMLINEAEAVRRIVYDFYLAERQRPSLRGILEKIRHSEMGFKGGLTTLRNVLFKLGFKWQKTLDKKDILLEPYNIRRQRVAYLRTISKYRAEGRNIVFTDELYLRSSDGYRLLMIDGEAGVVPSAVLIFSKVNKSGDSDDKIYQENFMQCIRTQLLPSLPPRSVLILDCASHHNVEVEINPTSASSKEDMIKWLCKKKIPFKQNLIKPELYNIIKMHKSPHKMYKLDILLRKHGHDVLRIPRYHPELNPIGKVWTIKKNWVAGHSETLKFDDVEALARTTFEEIVADDWVEICQHCKELEEEYISREKLLDNIFEELEFDIDCSDEESDFSDNESDGLETLE